MRLTASQRPYRVDQPAFNLPQKYPLFPDMIKLVYQILLLFAVLFCTCGPARMEAQLRYDFSEPVLLVELPKELAEISGLGLLNKELVAVNDEDGQYYHIDPRTREISEPTDFWKDGDYEGITVVGQDIWVVKSTGTLYHIKRAGTQEQSVQKIKTWLSKDNNVEGLGYDAANHRLLLACKGEIDGMDNDYRYVFAFDLDRMKLGTDAVLTVPHKTQHKFSPSSIAVEPETGNLYMTSSVKNQLMVMSPGGEVLETYRYNRDLMPQPEGITFGHDGTLYISTEARGDQPARIYKLPLRPEPAAPTP